MGNKLRYGIDAYQKTMRLKNAPPVDVFVSHKKPNLVKVTGKEHKESKYRRVAKFLILIGGDYASKILGELEPAQVELILKEIALIKIIKPEERDEILAEFNQFFSGNYQFSGSSRGGIEAARRILYAAKGPEKGEALLNKAVPESKDNLFGFLEDFTPNQLVMLLKTEAAQTTALILSRLSVKLSAAVLSKVPQKQKAGILRKMAHQGLISPEVLEQVAAALRERVRNITGGAKDIEVNGMQALTAILKQGDYSFGDRLIQKLEESNPGIGRSLKENLYTLDDIINTADRTIQDKLKTMSDNQIAVLLKGRKSDFSKKILSCVSAVRRKHIREEYDILGALLKSECDAAANEFLAWFRAARENGEIILYSDEDVFL
jgi:flagellar motor switch protein FliG